MGSDWKNLPALPTQTDTTQTVAALFVTTDRQTPLLERAMTRRIFQALPTQTDTTKTVAALFVTIDRQTDTTVGTSNDWKNLPRTAHTDKHCCFNI
jgi:hypothetical protein